MVWALIPSDSLRGAQKYYIFSKGTYNVGRKDCDIIVQTDTSISRIHAQIVVDEMVVSSSSTSSCVRVIDKSKYGTFMSKGPSGSKVRLVKNKDAAVSEGDLVTFGTSTATFRFCFIPIVFFVQASDPSVQATISSIGAQSSCNWNPECTHALVEESSPITKDLTEAVVVKKPIALVNWLNVLTEKNIRTEFPSCKPYAPTLTLIGTSIQIVDPAGRDKCLEGFTFVLGSLQKYKFEEKLQSLLEVVGAKFLGADEFSSDSQTSADGKNNYVLVVPGESPNKLIQPEELSSLSRITDLQLIAAIFSGCLDTDTLVQPSIVVSSSHSTDETIVADSDIEMETATSNIVADTANFQDGIKYEPEEHEAKISPDREYTSERKENKDLNDYLNTSTPTTSSQKDEGVAPIKKMDKGGESLADRHQNSDILYTQDLIVRDIFVPVSVQPTTEVVNFKCFRKRNTVSGNSFSDLIPFSKDPYKESDYGSSELEYMREEKKRKQMEAIAEDLFNNEKAKKRAVGGASLESFLCRR